MMEKNEIFRKIDAAVHELNDQYEDLLKNRDDFDEAELELLASGANFLSEQIRMISRLSRQKKQAPVPVPEVDIEETPASETTVIPAETPRQPVENRQAEPVTESPAAGEEPVVHEVVIKEKTISVDTPVTERSGVPTLNELISAQRSQSTLGSSYGSKPVKDLKSIISLNDKLQFVKDLFNGYNLAYSEAIELLNRFDNFESAENFLKNNYAVKNNWAEKQATVDKFYEVLNRRFAK